MYAFLVYLNPSYVSARSNLKHVTTAPKLRNLYKSTFLFMKYEYFNLVILSSLGLGSFLSILFPSSCISCKNHNTQT